MQFVKGHGTENDFVLLPDPDAGMALTPSLVRALCDHRRGLGADGVLRVVRTAALDEAPAVSADTEWFMDYRNSDGSLAEMCGNGVRVFARYLVDAGLVPPGELVVGTRSGPRAVVAPADGDVTVDMGPASVLGGSTARVDGELFAGLAVDLGNPHLACVTTRPLDRLDLTRPPGHDPGTFPNGVNVGFVRPLGGEAVAVRVHERGVGETRSCGTGTVAAVVAVLRATGRIEGGRDVHTPGGRLHVDVTASTTTLTGPAVLVARGELDEAWCRSAGSKVPVHGRLP